MSGCHSKINKEEIVGSTFLGSLGVGFIVSVESQTKVIWITSSTQTSDVQLNNKKANKMIHSALVYYS